MMAKLRTGALIATFILSFLILSPYLVNGFWNDDSLNSQLSGVLGLEQVGFFEFTIKYVTDWMKAGRFFPVSLFTTYGGFYLIQDLEGFRLVQVLLVAINIFLFGSLVWKISNNFFFSIFWTSLFFACLQMRGFYDPVASFGFLLQYICLYTLGSLILFKIFLDNGSRLAYSVSVLVFSLGLLTYELSLVGIPLLFLLAFKERKNWKTSVLLMLPFLALVAIYLTITWYLRSKSSLMYSGISIGHLRNFPQTFFFQVFASFPLSFAISPASPLSINEIVNIATHSLFYWSLFLFIFVFYGTCLWCATKTTLDRETIVFFGSFGFVLAVAPTIPVALSSRYQTEITLGLCYLPVYISYFGTSLLLACLFFWISREAGKFSKKYIFLWLIPISGSLASIIISNMVVAKEVTRSIDRVAKYPRTVIEYAIAEGLLEAVTTEDLVLLNWNNIWIKDSLFYQFSKKRNRVITLADQERLFPQINWKKIKNVYWIDLMMNSEKSGTAFLSKIDFKDSPIKKTFKHFSKLKKELISGVFYGITNRNETDLLLAPTKVPQKQKIISTCHRASTNTLRGLYQRFQRKQGIVCLLRPAT